ncbi:MAG: elongation factor P [Alphaproteobacteria bacterium]|nr:elongation factor P [Alphaproteobacteria bacterium]MBR1480147.1 elongation factor P [Alphaproteobacteria bacterium]
MKISANDIRIGNVLEHNSKLWIVTKTQHVQPGKGGAFMQTEMKELRGGQKLNERFRTADTVEKVFLEEKAFQFLYRDGDDLHFMDQTTYEQIQLPADLVGDAVAFLADGMVVNICLYENSPISVSLPATVTLEIVEAEPVVKGQTATSSYKPAILSNGVKIMVPQHIEPGTMVVVDTSNASYVERAK